jgi:uncharacterized membrane protein YqaE (UPF0057 family)
MMALSSCSVMKSHYGRGYSIAWNTSKSLKKANDLQQYEPLATEAQRIFDLSDVNQYKPWAEDNQHSSPHATDWTAVATASNKIVHPSDSRKKMEVLKIVTSFYDEPIQVNEAKVTTANGDAPEDKWLLILLAFFLPPLTIYLLDNTDTQGLIISCVLTIIGCGIPGVIYAIVKVIRKYESSSILTKFDGTNQKLL